MTVSSQSVEPFDLVIFGGTGDLAVRKLLPALFHRFVDGQIPTSSRIVGVAREALDDDGYSALLRTALTGSVDGAQNILGISVAAVTTAWLDLTDNQPPARIAYA